MIIAVTPGDPHGIGPEVVWKTIKSRAFATAEATLLCVGAREPFEALGAKIIEVSEADLSMGVTAPKLKTPFVWLLKAPAKAPAKKFLPGYQAGWSIEKATRLVQNQTASALVTGPISKERLQRGGYPFPGHTEFLAFLCGTDQVTMMLANEALRISLVTTHIALKDVSRALTAKKIYRAVTHTADNLRKWWAIPKPCIAVAALNPHAGEGGLFGAEELRVITPALDVLRRKLGSSCLIEGPLPADTLFARHVMAKAEQKYDAVVCMYHDQGLIPVKLLDFPKTVNVSLGLPIVRTSVDHGTGFDIAGKGIADPSSFQAAVRLAIRISKNQLRRSS